MQTVNLHNKMELVYVQRLEQLLRQYLLVGGMPAAVQAYAYKVPMEEIQRLQSGLIRTYSDDFAKYASSSKHKYFKEVYASAPRMVGQRYKYSHVNPDIESKFFKESLGLLCDARCMVRIFHASGAEPYSSMELYFWARDARGSSAEVDYLIAMDSVPLPVEVKAGKTGSLKSMRLFLDIYPKTPLGIRYSMHELSYHDKILSIPLYMISRTPHLIRSATDQ